MAEADGAGFTSGVSARGGRCTAELSTAWGLVGPGYGAGRAEGQATTDRRGRPRGARQSVPTAWPGDQLAKAQQAEHPWTTGCVGWGPGQADREGTRAGLEPRRADPEQERS